MSNVVTFRVAGLEANVDLNAITGHEWRDMKRATGLHQRELLSHALVWEDFDAQAAFVWLAFRVDLPDATYDDVLALFSYDAVNEGGDDGG